jgi:hypothetical protein
VAAASLPNGNGTFTVQAANLRSEATYYLRVAAAPAPAPSVGNYSLVADFGGVTANLQTFAGGSLSSSDTLDDYTLYIGQTQLLQFALSTDADGVPTDARVRLEIFGAAGNLVFTLVSRAGETVSGSSVLLTPGEYRVRLTVESPSGGTVPLIRYRLRGVRLSDPVGPAREDPTMDPMYQCPDDPSVYCYPDGTRTSDPYYFYTSE